MLRSRSRKRKRGQFLMLAALTVTVMIMSSTVLIAYISISRVNLPKTEFRETVTQISLNSRRALATALAHVSKNLNLMASVREYNEYNKLEDYPQAEEKGHEFILKWFNDTLINNAGLGLNLTLSEIDFECRWDTYQGYSIASSNLTLDIGAYGFYNWSERIETNLNLTVLGLDDMDENSTSFYFSLYRENNVPVSSLTVLSVKLLYNKTDGRFVEVAPSSMNLRYVGNGTYRLQFESPQIAIPPRIKLVVQDERAILVGSFPQNGTILSSMNDTIGPEITILTLNPNPCYGIANVTLSAVADDSNTGWSTIVAVEYFVDTIGENGTGTSMSPSDGIFDSPIESVYAVINVTGWPLGNYMIYVHGKDSAGYWGNFSSIQLILTETNTMHVESIDMSGSEEWWWFWRRTRATAVVTVVDGSGDPVEGATIYGSWSGEVNDDVEGITDENGQVVFTTEWSNWDWWYVTNTYTFTVTDIVLEGYTYTPEENEETSDSITI